MSTMKLVAVVLLSAVSSGQASDDGFKWVANELHTAMNESVDPCDNFYEFACGNWKNVHTGKYDYDKLTSMFVSSVNKLGVIMEKYDTSKQMHVPFPYNQAGIVFAECMSGNGAGNNPMADKVMMDHILNLMSGWPTLGYWEYHPHRNVLSVLQGNLIGRSNMGPYFTSSRVQNILHPLQPQTLLFEGVEVYTDNASNKPKVTSHDDVIYAYSMMTKRLAAVNGNKTVNSQLILEDAIEVAKLEVTAEMVTWDAMNWTVPMTNDQYFNEQLLEESNMFDTQSAIKRWPNMNWAAILLHIGLANVPLNDVFGVDFFVGYPQYMDWLNDQFGNVPERTMRNWLFFKFAQKYEAFVTTADSELFWPSSIPKSKQAVVAGDITPAGRCAQKLMARLPQLSGRIWADESGLTRADLADLNDMIGVVLSSWHGMIQEVPWMSSYSKSHAFAKIANVARNVGWPAWIENDAALTNYYMSLNMTTMDDSFTQMIKTNRFQAYVQYSQLGAPANRDEDSWFSSDATVNAWYYPIYNSITFPAAIMVAPMFSRQFPAFFNYAHLGWVMGHELGHGFDNSGVHFGPHGEYFKNTWFDEASQAGFNNMAQCVVDEYDKFCLMLEGKKYCVNGQRGLGENIADNGGIHASHRGYMAITNLAGGEPSMPSGYGIISSMTPEQLYFTSAANTWCSNWPAKALISLLENDPHSPDVFRVNGVVQNVPLFASAFKCASGTAMAPKNRCTVWTKPPM